MALEINAQFSKFVQFAQERFDAGKTKAIARIDDSVGALLTQESRKASCNGSIIALSPNANEMAFNVCGDEENTTAEFDISFGSDGSLVVKNTYEKPSTAVPLTAMCRTRRMRNGRRKTVRSRPVSPTLAAPKPSSRNSGSSATPQNARPRSKSN